MENPYQRPPDILSTLPDDILGKILSFLPLKMAVATSVLSRRWKDLWKHDLSILDFDNTFYLSDKTPNEEGDKLFRDFVQGVLDYWMSKNSSKLIKLRFHYEDMEDYGIPGEWFSTFWNINVPPDMWNRIKELELTIWTDKLVEAAVEVQESLFTSATLVSIKIDVCNFVIYPERRVHLPNVKLVHLRSVMPETDSSIVRLLEGCPVLEELVVAELDMASVEVVKIHCSKLKRLMISSCQDLEIHCSKLKRLTINSCGRLEINTPNLEYFEVNHSKDLYIQNLSSLTEVKLCAWEDPDSAFDLLESISHAKSLTLGIHTVEGLCKTPRWFPNFSNLVRLEIFLCENAYTWRAVHELLEESPMLEVLTLDCSFVGSHSKEWFPPEEIPKGFLKRLRILKMRHYEKQKNVWNLIQHIKRHARRRTLYSFLMMA